MEVIAKAWRHEKEEDAVASGDRQDDETVKHFSSAGQAPVDNAGKEASSEEKARERGAGKEGTSIHTPNELEYCRRRMVRAPVEERRAALALVRL